MGLLVALSSQAGIDSFGEAKKALRAHVYHDRNASSFGDLYCGCQWRWVGATGGRVEAASCGYEVRAQETRGRRTEWEHIVPAWTMGHQRQCWQNGGRKNCNGDPVFRRMEGDPFNLSPVVGELNADRSNYNFGMLPGARTQYGACDFKVDFKQRAAEPRDEAKGVVARTYFYIFDRYGLRMSRQQQQLMMAWDRQHPVTPWELERERRIARVAGHRNQFVTGERTWSLNHKPSREGLVAVKISRTAAQSSLVRESPAASSGGIRGNRNSKIYHLPKGCPSYNAVSPKNRVAFDTVAEAKAAGYRQARNCS